jgi:hypothetical protein
MCGDNIDSEARDMDEHPQATSGALVRATTSSCCKYHSRCCLLIPHDTPGACTIHPDAACYELLSAVTAELSQQCQLDRSHNTLQQQSTQLAAVKPSRVHALMWSLQLIRRVCLNSRLNTIQLCLLHSMGGPCSTCCPHSWQERGCAQLIMTGCALVLRPCGPSIY